MKINHNILIVFLLVLGPILSKAQTNTSSPYSLFGVGDLSNISYGRNLALGGTGYALRASNFLNMKNPASLTSIDSLSVLFETGVFAKYTENSSSQETNSAWDGNLTHLAFGHRYTSRLMVNYGMMPYSDIGYHFQTIQTVESGTSLVYTNWDGTGGISKMFYGLGYKVSEHLSLGGEIAFHYGSINQTREVIALVQYDNPTFYSTSTVYRGYSYKGAFQYITNFGDEGTNLVIGGVFNPTQIFAGKTSIDIYQYYGSTATSVYSVDDSDNDEFEVPLNYGAGFGLTLKNKYLVTADFEASPWSNNNTRDYYDRQVYSLGFERLPQVSFDYFDRCSYRIGLRYDSGYFKVKSTSIDDMRFTIGMGLPVLKSRSTVNLSLEVGQRGTTNSSLLRERYTKFTMAFSFHDYWFNKRKID